MIKNCLRSETDFYRYDIKHNGEVIAKAHTLSIRELSRYMTGSDGSKVELENTDGLILAALDSWEFSDKDGKELPINTANIRDLTDEYYLALVKGITEHEAEVRAEAKEIEKN